MFELSSEGIADLFDRCAVNLIVFVISIRYIMHANIRIRKLGEHFFFLGSTIY